MIELILFYLLLNSLFLAYIRLRDVGKLAKVNTFFTFIFILYIGLFAFPLQILYYVKNLIFKRKI